MYLKWCLQNNGFYFVYLNVLNTGGIIYFEHEMWYMSSIPWKACHLVARNDAPLYADSVYATMTGSLFLHFLGIDKWLYIDIGCRNFCRYAQKVVGLSEVP